ncbi:MAG: hypothetical protein M1833_003227 [Piccolia ochrophora]|nr:MAG: hypothetical protein M1833_003227 [Piccolia ochrophora]
MGGFFLYLPLLVANLLCHLAATNAVGGSLARHVVGDAPSPFMKRDFHDSPDELPPNYHVYPPQPQGSAQPPMYQQPPPQPQGPPSPLHPQDYVASLPVMQEITSETDWNALIDAIVVASADGEDDEVFDDLRMPLQPNANSLTAYSRWKRYVWAPPQVPDTPDALAAVGVEDQADNYEDILPFGPLDPSYLVRYHVVASGDLSAANGPASLPPVMLRLFDETKRRALPCYFTPSGLRDAAGRHLPPFQTQGHCYFGVEPDTLGGVHVPRAHVYVQAQNDPDSYPDFVPPEVRVFMVLSRNRRY